MRFTICEESKITTERNWQQIPNYCHPQQSSHWSTKRFGSYSVERSRKPPVAINSDDNEDNQIYISKNVQRSRSITDTRHMQHSEEDDDDDDSPNEDEHSDDANEEGTDDAADLRELDDKALASALAFERARSSWSSKQRGNKQSDNDLPPDMELTTASELDGKPFEDEQDEDENPLAEDDENDIQDNPPRRNHKTSKHERAHRAEVLRFSQEVSSTKCHPPKRIKPSDLEGEELSDNDDSLSHDINEDWDHNTRYVPPHAGARMISIKAQPPSLQLVIKVAFREVTGDALFVTAYPSAATIADYYHDILKKSA
ncbi:hypothetical protein BJV77DRAFT_962129 [Russula vinacea]|nr:hypothetical protein BJV77DRAFT_962129 [Russula vinacea]